MQFAILLGLFSPLIGFLILLASSSFIKRNVANIIGCGTILISFLCFVLLLVSYTNSIHLSLYNWVPVAGINADFNIDLDSLSLLMTLIITGVGFLIHVYSIGYMDHDEDYARYFGCMNLFVFSMLLLVLAGNLLLLFVGWEGVGLASYLLIGYYYSRPAAAAAATKAFVVNRIGDFGFLLGLLLTFTLFGTSDIESITQQAAQKFAVGAPIITLLTLLYFCGAVGKSAQIPLHVWLPDAMEGPTPVSALIHAATMVTAGVYLVVRLHALFMLAPITMQIIGVIGGATALFAALCAIGQTDLKRVLAYSTVSQLGLMFLACGSGAFYAAMFHLTTHAFVKALLFLSAGNVVHMLNGATSMDKMGGLAGKFPLTHWLFLIGVFALSGVPPFAAFFSKDLILEQEYLTGYKTLFWVGLAASILTAFYMTRAYCLTFTGKSRLPEKIFKNVKEAPRVMLLPVIILAILALCGGFLGFSSHKTPVLEGFLAKVGVTLAEEEGPEYIYSWETIVSIIGAIAGIVASAFLYVKFADRFQKPIEFLKKSFYVDEIYSALFVKPLEMVSKGIVNVVEPDVFDGSIRSVVHGTQDTAGLLQKMQSGQIRSYVAWMAVGLGLVIVYLIF